MSHEFCQEVMGLLSNAGQPLDDALTCSDAEGNFHQRTLQWEETLSWEWEDSEK
jgi:hypothetical protein